MDPPPSRSSLSPTSASCEDSKRLLESYKASPSIVQRYEDLHNYLKNQAVDFYFFENSILLPFRSMAYRCAWFRYRLLKMSLTAEALCLKGIVLTKCTYLQSQALREYRCEFPIPKGNAGFLIGRGGETLRALEEEFKLHIHVEKIPTADMQRIVVIVGDNATAVYSARNKILSLVGN